jgi:hypothetical protein
LHGPFFPFYFVAAGVYIYIGKYPPPPWREKNFSRCHLGGKYEKRKKKREMSKKKEKGGKKEERGKEKKKGKYKAKINAK